MKAALIQIPEEIRRLINLHQPDLEEAWAVKEADESLIISFSVKIGLDKKGNNICEISISFVKDRIKDGTTFFWDDRQLPLLKEVHIHFPDPLPEDKNSFYNGERDEPEKTA